MLNRRIVLLIVAGLAAGEMAPAAVAIARPRQVPALRPWRASVS